MSKPRLIYFDNPASRGEECRLALHVAGVDFEDVRIQRDAWPALKPSTPFGSMPVLEMPGQPALGQSNAILALVGRLHGLHPSDPFEAARHEAMMAHVEDLRAMLAPSARMTDEAEKKKAREALVASTLPRWAEHAEKHVAPEGPFFGGAKINVVDFKIYIAYRWLASGKLDHVPNDIFSSYLKLTRVHDAVRDDARVQAWYARR
jgi:glutathione S-transferase